MTLLHRSGVEELRKKPPARTAERRRALLVHCSIAHSSQLHQRELRLPTKRVRRFPRFSCASRTTDSPFVVATARNSALCSRSRAQACNRSIPSSGARLTSGGSVRREASEGASQCQIEERGPGGVPVCMWRVGPSETKPSWSAPGQCALQAATATGRALSDPQRRRHSRSWALIRPNFVTATGLARGSSETLLRVKSLEPAV